MDNNTPEINIEKIENESPKKAKEKKKREKKRRGFSYYFTNGRIMSWLGSLTEAIYRALFGGLFGLIFTSYSAEERAFEGGYIKGRIFSHDRIKGYWRKIRQVFAQGFESSMSLGVLRRICNTFLETTLKNYGNYMISFGLFSVFVYFVRTFVPFLGDASTNHLVSGVIFIVLSIPMLASKKSLAQVLRSSLGARAVLCDVFGMRDESFEILPKQSKTRANLSIIFGIASGMLTFVVEPVQIPIALLIFAGVAVIIATPEVGVVTSLFLLPFMSFTSTPSIYTAFLVGVSAVGYLVKLIRGKRILRFEILDVCVAFFFVTMLVSGFISLGKESSLNEALMACMLMTVYFLVANMIRTREWVNRCVIALVSSATLTSIIGVLEYFFGDVSTGWLDTNYFGDIRGRVVSLFDNSNVLAFYLVMVFPFAIDLVSRCKSKREKFLARFSVLSIVLCVIFTWSRGAWLGLIVAALLYMIIKTKKIIKAILAFCLSIPILSIVLPSNIINRFMSIGDLADSSTYYRVLTWRGSLDAIGDSLLVGYGYGSAAFERVYPTYAYAGIEAAEHSHSLYLQILFGMGLLGFAVFFLVMLFFAQKNLEFFAKTELRSYKNSSVAAFVAVVAALVMGMFDYIWYNNRILFLFFAIMGIASAVIRTSNDLEKRKHVDDTCDARSACIDIN